MFTTTECVLFLCNGVCYYREECVLFLGNVVLTTEYVLFLCNAGFTSECILFLCNVVLTTECVLFLCNAGSTSECVLSLCNAVTQKECSSYMFSRNSPCHHGQRTHDDPRLWQHSLYVCVCSQGFRGTGLGYSFKVRVSRIKFRGERVLFIGTP